MQVEEEGGTHYDDDFGLWLFFMASFEYFQNPINNLLGSVLVVVSTNTNHYHLRNQENE